MQGMLRKFTYTFAFMTGKKVITFEKWYKVLVESTNICKLWIANYT